MGLDNLALTEMSVISLYKNLLVHVNTTTENQNLSYHKHLGNNQARITVVVNHIGSALIEQRHLSFITKMLNACHLNIGDIALINHHDTPVEIKKLKAELDPRIVILFGTSSLEIKLPFDFPQFKLQDYDECTFLCVPGLNEIDSDVPDGKLLKTKLWICLRGLFE